MRRPVRPTMRRCSMDGDRRSQLATLAGLSRSTVEDHAGSESPYFPTLPPTPIPHRSYQTVLKRVAALHLRHHEGHKGGGMLVTGQSGSGKSFLCKTYAGMFPPEEGPTGTRVPVLYAEAPPHPTIASMPAVFLHALGATAARGGSTEQKETDRLVHFLAELGTEMILLDEVNNLHDHAGRSVLAAVTDWIKSLQSRTDVAVVMFGLPRSTSVVLRNMQLRRRFFGRMSLAPFSMNSAQSWGEFRSVLQVLHHRTPVEAVQYSQQLLARRFFYASSGLMDYLHKIINKAIEVAVRDGGPISEATLAEAFATDVWDGCPDEQNPFLTAPKNLRLLTQPGEPFDDWDFS